VIPEASSLRAIRRASSTSSKAAQGKRVLNISSCETSSERLIETFEYRSS